MKVIRTLAPVAASAILVSLGAAATPAAATAPADVGTITIGSANFPENELLAQIYGQALAAEGFEVGYELNIGSRDIYYPAIENAEVDLLPEYTNSLLSHLLRPDLPTATNVPEQIAALEEALPEGLEVLTPSSAENKDTIVCTADVADEHGLVDLTSLAAASGEIVLGAPPEFEDRSPFGLEGFAEILGATFAEFVPLSYGDIPAALSEGAIDCGNIFSTSSAIASEGFVPLVDDQGLVPNEAVLPLIRSEVATPEVVAVLDGVSAALDSEILTGLVALVEVEAIGADEVAADWLASDPQPVGDPDDMVPDTTVPG